MWCVVIGLRVRAINKALHSLFFQDVRSGTELLAPLSRLLGRTIAGASINKDKGVDHLGVVITAVERQVATEGQPTHHRLPYPKVTKELVKVVYYNLQ